MEKKRLQAMMFLVVLLTAFYVTQTSARPPLGKQSGSWMRISPG